MFRTHNPSVARDNITKHYYPNQYCHATLLMRNNLMHQIILFSFSHDMVVQCMNGEGASFY